jgi:metallo-beta-lactamase class B
MAARPRIRLDGAAPHAHAAVMRWLAALFVVACHPASPNVASGDREIRTEWARAIEPFRIAGNLYYVGGHNIAAYLVATSDGLILIDTGPREMAPVIRAGIAKLGFRVANVKVLLISHAHWDHVEGLASMQRDTGAKVMVMDAEAEAIRSGKDLSAYGGPGWEPVRVDRVLHDGDDVVLGETTLHAVWTPGHTQGTTSWRLDVTDHGRRYDVLLIGAIAANAGVPLRDNPRHPTIAADLARTAQVMKGLHPDIYLYVHPDELWADKLGRVRAGDPSALVDPAGYQRFIAEAAADTEARLAAERPH